MDIKELIDRLRGMSYEEKKIFFSTMTEDELKEVMYQLREYNNYLKKFIEIVENENGQLKSTLEILTRNPIIKGEA